MTPSRRAAAAAVIISALVPVGCQVVTDLHAPNPVSTMATQPPEASDAASPCSDKLPPRPAGGEGPSLRDPVQLVFSYYDMATLPTATDEELCPKAGFLLDDVGCPTDADAGRCRVSCGTPARPYGVDNVLGDEFQKLRQTAAALPAGFDPVYGLSHGQTNLMLSLGEYNGLSDDPHVIVSFYALVGIANDAHPFVDAATDGSSLAEWTTAWDRKSLETWLIDETSVDYRLGVSALYRAEGWVSGGVLVVQSPRVPFLVGSIPLQVERATLTGQLRPQGDRWTIARGRLGGEVRKTTLRDGIAFVKGPLCAGVNAAASLACGKADRQLDGNCDAISFALSFTMVEGRLGPLSKLPPNGHECESAGCE